MLLVYIIHTSVLGVDCRVDRSRQLVLTPLPPPPPRITQQVGEDSDFLLRDDLTPELVPELTHYEILGFEKYGNGVGDEMLKKAYRKAVLKYHPDKTGVQDGEEDEVGGVCIVFMQGGGGRGVQ